MVKYNYGKLPDKEAEFIPRNKLYVNIIVTYIIRKNRGQDDFNLKAVTITEPIALWFQK